MGDRVLVRVEEGEERTNVGLYLPPTALDNQAVQGGTIVATGPGMPMPAFDANTDEPWRIEARETRFIPMQARRGDFALFFRKASVEITFEGERFLVERVIVARVELSEIAAFLEATLVPLV